MKTDGVAAVFLTTHNWGKAAKFFQALGFTLDQFCRDLRPGKSIAKIDIDEGKIRRCSLGYGKSLFGISSHAYDVLSKHLQFGLEVHCEEHLVLDDQDLEGFISTFIDGHWCATPANSAPQQEERLFCSRSWRI